MAKLHLGCGQNYLSGYLNIDFPDSEHSVQKISIADLQTNILTLQYIQNSIDEIRLHHVFEHFTRPVAVALIASWRSWLKPNAILRIEVPDFHRTAQVILSPFTTFKQKMTAERHIFGSHEATWAVHCDGYTQQSLTELLKCYQFDIKNITKNQWRGTYNIEIISQTKLQEINKEECKQIAKEFLSKFLIDSTKTEVNLLNVWLDLYDQQIEVSWGIHK